MTNEAMARAAIACGIICCVLCTLSCIVNILVAISKKKYDDTSDIDVSVDIPRYGISGNSRKIASELPQISSRERPRKPR